MRWGWVVLLAGCRIGFDSGPSDAPNGQDVGAGSDAEIVSPCPSTIMFRDQFDDGVVAPEWISLNQSGVSHDEFSGGWSIRVDGATPPSTFASYVQGSGFDATDVCVTAELGLAPVAGTYAFLTLGTFGTDQKVELAVGGSNIEAWFRNELTNERITVAELPSLAADHRFLRVQHDQLGFSFLQSSDGIAFTLIGRSSASMLDIANVTVRIGGGTSDGVASETVIQWVDLTIAVP